MKQSTFTIKRRLQRQLTRPRDEPSVVVHPPVRCRDGFRVSVQASHFHYCSPRDDVGPYTAVELGFPSRRDFALMRYAETREKPRDTVYGYVPLRTVAKVLARHGGLK